MIKYFMAVLFSVVLIMSCSVPVTSNIAKGDSQQPPSSGGQETNKPIPDQNPNPKPNYVGPITLTVKSEKIDTQDYPYIRDPKPDYPNFSRYGKLLVFLTENHDWFADSTLEVKLDLSSNDVYTANVTGLIFKIVDYRKGLNYVELTNLESAQVIERGGARNSFKVKIVGKIKSQYRDKTTKKTQPTPYDNTTVSFTMNISVPDNKYWEDQNYPYFLTFEDLQHVDKDAVAAFITQTKDFKIYATKTVNK